MLLNKPHSTRWLATLFVLILAACGDSNQSNVNDNLADSNQLVELRRLATRAQQVSIIRDDYGVPHIYGKTDADAVFGMLYAQAEDDFPRVERNYIWAIGRLAEVEGESALYSDLRARLYMTVDQAKAAYNSAPRWLQELCIAFADGLNYYLATHPEVTPKLITQFEPWMPMFFFEGSIGGDIEQIPLAGIKAFYSADENMPAQAIEQLTQQATDEPSGSNGFAIAGKLTESGNLLLLINPHTSFYFRGEIHVVSEQGLNAYGAVTWGQFFVYQGFNQHNGWMHTSTYADFKDEFIEEVFSKDGKLFYRYGDEQRPVEVSEVTLKFKTDNGLKQQTFPMYRTHHGPITHKIDNKWVATKINWDPVNALKQSFIRTKTKDHDEFREMMRIKTNSSNNTVYADSSGNIAYYHGNFMPKRSLDFDYSKPVDGSNPATDWQGLHTVEETITLLNPDNGWIQNCNSTPFTAAAEFSPKAQDYPAYMAPEPENYRGVHAIKVLTGAKDLTIDKLIDLAYDPYLPAFAEFIPSLVKAFDGAEQIDAETKQAVEQLRQWNYQVAADSIAMTLAHFYGLNLIQNAEYDRSLGRMARIKYFANRLTGAEHIRLFKETLSQLTNDFGDWRQPWSEVNRFQRLNGDINLPFDDDKPSVGVNMASGLWGSLAAYGAQRYNTKKLYGYRGNSFVAAVEFGDKVKAKTLLAGGQSGNPKSKHFLDQLDNYLNAEFKDVAYYKEDVIKKKVIEYHPGE
ncbi:MAG: penicillin acylase family protein [Kangiellaceae bacterium]|jgi:acyl-homoserine lactone acylase PvdQ|nr:penicillin acylase family protein [Kangiellaceae bacterium]